MGMVEIRKDFRAGGGVWGDILILVLLIFVSFL